MKFYAVKKGRKPGVYRTWAEAKRQVDGYSGAKYKSFTKITDATEYLDWKQEEVKQTRAKPRAYFATIYTDGGTRNTGNYKGGHVRKTDKAAWAYLIEWQEEGCKKSTYDSNGEFGATNNKMELTALIEALKKLLDLRFNQKPLLFVLDSQYVLNPITKGWLKKWKSRGWTKSGKSPIANLECWQELDQLLSNFSQTEFKWTKGHANNRGNEFVDHTLNEFMDQMQLTECNNCNTIKQVTEKISNIMPNLFKPITVLISPYFIENTFSIFPDVFRQSRCLIFKAVGF